MAINKHGLKMTGLKEAALATRVCDRNGIGNVVELAYNSITGEIFFEEFINSNSYVSYNDSDIITITTYNFPTSQQKISDDIFEYVQEINT